MKRFLLKLVVILMFALFFMGCCLVSKANADEIKANEEVEQEVQEVVEEQDDYSIEQFKEDLTNKLSQYLDKDIVSLIIKVLLDTGMLGALFGVYLKYRKYKHTTLEDVAKSSEELINNKIDEIKALQSDADKQNAEKVEQILKILILSQDNSTKGKIALLEYLGVKTDNEEIATQTLQVKGQLEEEQAKQDKINQAVQDDYKPLF